MTTSGVSKSGYQKSTWIRTSVCFLLCVSLYLLIGPSLVLISIKADALAIFTDISISLCSRAFTGPSFNYRLLTFISFRVNISNASLLSSYAYYAYESTRFTRLNNKEYKLQNLQELCDGISEALYTHFYVSFRIVCTFIYDIE